MEQHHNFRGLGCREVSGDAIDDTPEITGLPPDIILLAEIESMKRRMEDLLVKQRASFEPTLVDQLNKREVGGSGFARGNEIVEMLETLLEKVSEVLRATQAAPSVPVLSPLDDEAPPELGKGDGYVLEEETSPAEVNRQKGQQ